jgi:phosphatidylserine decarboxylase
MITPYGLREVVVGTVLCAAAGWGLALLPPPANWAAVLPGLFWLYLLVFFRDPPRTVPDDPLAVVSPADGVVTDITDLDAPEFIAEPSVRVGIFLSVIDVHVNRTPCAGRVEYLQYKAGEFLDARREDCTHRNESNALGLVCERWGNAKVLVRQIAGLIARRIVCAAKPGDVLSAGQRYGMIKFGSRTEVILPKRLAFAPSVKVGDRVKGGSTILGRVSV